jgi:hypothetical protein
VDWSEPRGEALDIGRRGENLSEMREAVQISIRLAAARARKPDADAGQPFLYKISIASP